MPVSSKSLFHFTRSAESLIGILERTFFPKFCFENHAPLSMEGGYPFRDMAIPMVCFCDLPLSNVGEHLSFYGNYGIGLTKEWAIRKGINPVFYVSQGSYANVCISRISIDPEPLTDRHLVNVMELMAFIKPIEGEMKRDGRIIHRHFYDEREWRYVPNLLNQLAEYRPYQLRLSQDEFNRAIQASSHHRLDQDSFENEIERAKANRELETRIQLDFEPHDIKYIIVSKESEIESTIEAIRMIKRKYDSRIIDLLASRIVSSEQIASDF